MPRSEHFELYFFIIRLCIVTIIVLVHRGSRTCKLKRDAFPSWMGLLLAADLALSTKPPWWEPSHTTLYTPKQLFVSLLISGTTVSSILWWIMCTEQERRGLAVSTAVFMIFHRSTLGIVLFRKEKSTWLQAALSFYCLWLSLSASPHSTTRKRNAAIDNDDRIVLTV